MLLDAYIEGNIRTQPKAALKTPKKLEEHLLKSIFPDEKERADVNSKY